MNILLVGPGGMGTTHYHNYAQIPESRVTALVGTTPADREKAAEWKLPVYATISKAAQAERIDLADLCVPTYLHEPLALEAFGCGLHVITEKPCALTGKSAEKMFRAAEQAGKQLFVAQVVQFMKETEILRQIVDDGRYGRPLDGFFERLSARPAWSQGNWLMDREKSGLLPFDLHIHDLDLIVSLFGKPDRMQVTASGENQGLKDHLRVNYEWDNGMTVCGEAAWFNACLPFTARWRIYFEKAMLVCDEKGVTAYEANGQATRYDTSDPVQIAGGVNLPPNGWFFRELNHFLSCARNNVPSPLVTKQQVLAVLSALEAMPA